MKINSNWLHLTNDLLRQVESTVKAHALTEGRVLFCCPDWAYITTAAEFCLADEWLEYAAETAAALPSRFNDADVKACIEYGLAGIAAPGSNPAYWE